MRKVDIPTVQALVGEPGAEPVMAKIFKIPIEVLVGALGMTWRDFRNLIIESRLKTSNQFAWEIEDAFEFRHLQKAIFENPAKFKRRMFLNVVFYS